MRIRNGDIILKIETSVKVYTCMHVLIHYLPWKVGDTGYWKQTENRLGCNNHKDRSLTVLAVSLSITYFFNEINIKKDESEHGFKNVLTYVCKKMNR